MYMYSVTVMLIWNLLVIKERDFLSKKLYSSMGNFPPLLALITSARRNMNRPSELNIVSNLGNLHICIYLYLIHLRPLYPIELANAVPVPGRCRIVCITCRCCAPHTWQVPKSRLVLDGPILSLSGDSNSSASKSSFQVQYTLKCRLYTWSPFWECASCFCAVCWFSLFRLFDMLRLKLLVLFLESILFIYSILWFTFVAGNFRHRKLYPKIIFVKCMLKQVFSLSVIYVVCV